MYQKRHVLLLMQRKNIRAFDVSKDVFRKFGPALGTVGGFMVGGPAGAAVGSGLGSLAAGQNLERAILTGITSYASGAAMGALGGAAGSAGAATTGATTGATTAGMQGAVAANATNPAAAVQAAQAASAPAATGIRGALQTGINKAASSMGVTPDLAGFGRVYGATTGAQAANPELLAPEPYKSPPLEDRSYLDRLRANVQRRRPLYDRDRRRTLYAREGGIMSMIPEQMNDKELVSMAIAALSGKVPQEEAVGVLSRFTARFGEDALRDLMTQIQTGAIAQNAGKAEGMVRGAGDGMDDLVPAKLEGEQDVLLSDNEYVIPADVLSGIGNGSSRAATKDGHRYKKWAVSPV